MNKRIKELAEKAGLEQERWSTTSQFESFLEKFAELIVRECAGIADKAEPYKANDLILKHFGVE